MSAWVCDEASHRAPCFGQERLATLTLEFEKGGDRNKERLLRTTQEVFISSPGRGGSTENRRAAPQPNLQQELSHKARCKQALAGTWIQIRPCKKQPQIENQRIRWGG